MGEQTVNQETQPTAAETKMFTQEEVNNIVAERLGRARQQYADYDTLKSKVEEYDKIREENLSELQKANERADGIEKELNELKKANAVRDIRFKVSNETGVPLELLTAETEEECRIMAEKINAFAMPKGYPKVKDGGEVSGTPKQTTSQQFADWFKQVTEP